MIGPRRRCLHLALLLPAMALVGCARTAPPAPVLAGGPHPAATSRPAGVVQPSVPHPDAVIVQSGETLYGIARRYDVPVRSLIEANGLTPPYRLTSGRRLTLPQIRQHIVQPGETLYGISRLYGVDTSTLARSNGLQSPYRVRVGEALALPAPISTAGTRTPVPVIQATAPAAAYAAPAAAQATPSTAAPASVAPVVAATPPAANQATSGAVAVQPRASAPEQRTAALPPPAAPEARTTALPPPAAPEAQTAALPPPAGATRGARTFLWPVHGRIIGTYGNGEGGTHNDGINIAAPEGTTVVAADAGTVAYAGNQLRGYGNLVLIKHADGWMTAYAHNEALLVKRGEKVRRGQAIARVGATGAVGVPQLHFEIRHGTRALDPGDYLPPEAATASRTP